VVAGERLQWAANGARRRPRGPFCFLGDFDMAIWAEIVVGRYGFPPIPLGRWDNAQAACSYLALPRALEKVLPVIGAPVVKDKAGRALVLSLSRPNRRGEYPEVTPEILDRVTAYNKIDVDGLAATHTAVGVLAERERAIWELDQRINRRGIRIDLDFVRAAKRIAEVVTEPLLVEFAELTGGLSPYQVEKTRGWLKGRGFTLENLQGETVEDALETTVLPDDVQRVLEIRQITGPTSLAKLDTMLACAGADGRARGLFQYHGDDWTLVGAAIPTTKPAAADRRYRSPRDRGCRCRGQDRRGGGAGPLGQADRRAHKCPALRSGGRRRRAIWHRRLLDDRDLRAAGARRAARQV
jgi:hypothetical protein